MSLRDILPGRLASQLMVLLIGALVLAFALTTGLMLVMQNRSGDAAREAVAAERAGDVLVALNSIAPEGQADFAKAASTRTTRIEVADRAQVLQTAPDDRSRALAALIAAQSETDARAAILSRVQTQALDDPRNAGRNREVIMISVPLADTSRWLNFTVREPITWHTSADQTFLLIALGVMSLAVTGVVWMFIRRLTRPLTQLARAANRAARGDHAARVSELGSAELREAAEAFNKMQTEIARFDAERIRTIAAVGHDLRTPMTSLRIRAEMIDDKDLRDPMIATLDEMATMADGLVSYARDGQEEERVPDLDLAALLETLCQDRCANFHALARPKITGAPVSLSRAVGNLIDNALRYGGNAGVDVTLSANGRNISIKVADHGPGIPDDQLETILDPFTRGDTSRSAGGGGVGLGLSIAQRIIRSHGGELRLRNRDPQGLTAEIQLKR